MSALYVFRKKAALYGVQAPSPQTLSGHFIDQVPGYPRSLADMSGRDGITLVPPAS